MTWDSIQCSFLVFRAKRGVVCAPQSIHSKIKNRPGELFPWPVDVLGKTACLSRTIGIKQRDRLLNKSHGYGTPVAVVSTCDERLVLPC